MLFHKKKPVAAPGHVASHLAESRDLDRDFPSLAIARNVTHGYFPAWVESCSDDSNRRFYAMFPGSNAAQVRQRNHQADGAMAAHAEIADVVKEDDARGTRAVHGIAQQRAHDHVRTSRLVDHRRAKAVILRAKALAPFGDRAIPQVRTAGNYQPGGFAARVRVDDPDARGKWRIRKRFLAGVAMITKHAQISPGGPEEKTATQACATS